MAKTINISAESFKQLQDKLNAWLAKAQAWLSNYFHNIDLYGIIAVSAIGLGFVLLILGIIIII